MKNTFASTIRLPGSSLLVLFLIPFTTQGQSAMKSNKEDLATLSELNARFIKNYVHQDTVSHNQIIHKDFVCIENSGKIVGREEYMKEWADSYGKGDFKTFGFEDEYIRLFGDMALVRAKSVYTKVKDGVTVKGSSVYTDTYIKERGRWWCVQAQITPVK